VSRFFLIRHGEHDYRPGALAGRQPGIRLTTAGRAQADRLAATLADQGINCIFSSPMERCQQTAEPLARVLGANVESENALSELDFGEWTGQTWKALEYSSLFERYNRFRSGTRIPGGELMLETQARAVCCLHDLATRFPEGTLAIFTHGDVIRSLLLFFLGMPIDFVHRLTIDLASISILNLHENGAELQLMNFVPGRLPNPNF
jgi:broad specificity phosphatase PhoE